MTAMPRRVLLVDDDRDVREALSQSLELADYAVTACSAYISAADHISARFEGVIVTDVRMPGRDGFHLLEQVQAVDADIPVVVLTGEGDVPMAVRAMTGGAYDFLQKPCPPKALISAVARAMEKRALVLANRRLAAERTLLKALEDNGGDTSLSGQMEVVEKYLIEKALVQEEGRAARVADRLCLPRKTLYDKLKRHGLEPGRYRPPE